MDNKNTGSERFVNIESRSFFSIMANFSSNFLSEYFAIIKKTKWNSLKWKGLTLMKDPMSLSIYMQLLQDLKPKTILEFGTFEGGSALWMKDILTASGQECKIYTFDIDENNVKIKEDDKIIFKQLDNYEIKSFIETNKDIFINMEGPVLVIEDSHENVLELLTTINNFLKDGDYLVVEDTIDESKHLVMQQFLNNNQYLVDTKYCDFWGQNNSWNINSFLKKTKLDKK
jgi:cephalosporin hydroxylase